MIKIPKKLLPKKRFLPLTITLYSISFFLLYIILPAYLTFYLRAISIKLLLVFYFINLLGVFYLFKRSYNRGYYLKLKIQEAEEKINVLNDQNTRELKFKVALKEKIGRYGRLKEIIENINQDLDLESTADKLLTAAFLLIAQNRGSAVLYLVDNKTQKLSLFRAKKEDAELIIKEKEGDILDCWVLRQATALIVEDTNKDFRFDPEKLKIHNQRCALSLISAPLISENRFLGILRLDSNTAGFYTQDDLRLLVKISDLGAVALENAELFQKVQELAIRDGLTALYTRRYFQERLREECKRSSRQNTPFSLLMADIDYFKNYNDKFGHTAGDIVLKTVSIRISEFLGGYSPIAGRFGGEEFCIILPRLNKQQAFDVAEKLRKEIEKIKIILRRSVSFITVSVGVASFPDDAADDGEMILKADQAMYAAKQKGRNRTCMA